MSNSLNKVILIGNIGKDPEIRYTKSGKRIANFTLATSEKWKDRQSGESRERTDWHRIVVFNDGLADIIERFLAKGSKVYLEGHLRTRKWQSTDGKDNYVTEVILEGFQSNIIMLDKRPKDQDDSTKTIDTSFSNKTDEVSPMEEKIDFDDDIPF